MSRMVYFSPDISDNRPTIYTNKKKIIGIRSFRVSKSSNYLPVRFLKQIGAKLYGIVRLTSERKRKRSSCRVSSASLTKSRSYAETLDSQRAEAIEDCIEFLNSSSSLQRSNSVSSSF